MATNPLSGVVIPEIYYSRYKAEFYLMPVINQITEDHTAMFAGGGEVGLFGRFENRTNQYTPYEPTTIGGNLQAAVDPAETYAYELNSNLELQQNFWMALQTLSASHLNIMEAHITNLTNQRRIAEGNKLYAALDIEANRTSKRAKASGVRERPATAMKKFPDVTLKLDGSATQTNILYNYSTDAQKTEAGKRILDIFNQSMVNTFVKGWRRDQRDRHEKFCVIVTPAVYGSLLRYFNIDNPRIGRGGLNDDAYVNGAVMKIDDFKVLVDPTQIQKDAFEVGDTHKIWWFIKGDGLGYAESFIYEDQYVMPGTTNRRYIFDIRFAADVLRSESIMRQQLIIT